MDSVFGMRKTVARIPLETVHFWMPLNAIERVFLPCGPIRTVKNIAFKITTYILFMIYARVMRLLIIKKSKRDSVLYTFHGRDEDNSVLCLVRGQYGKEAVQLIISYKYLKHPELRLK